MWALWSMRNKRRHGERPMNAFQAASWAKDTTFGLWQMYHSSNRLRFEAPCLKWQPPSPGWVKVNTDAAFYETDNHGATACVLRDHAGSFGEAQAKWYDQILDACTMEAMACRDGLKMAIQSGFQRIHLETDCLDIIHLWKKREV
jgi:hypothetical protein